MLNVPEVSDWSPWVLIALTKVKPSTGESSSSLIAWSIVSLANFLSTNPSSVINFLSGYFNFNLTSLLENKFFCLFLISLNVPKSMFLKKGFSDLSFLNSSTVLNISASLSIFLGWFSKIFFNISLWTFSIGLFSLTRPALL